MLLCFFWQPWKFWGSDECIVTYTTKYMNRLDVQKALHVDIAEIPHPWTTCSNAVRANWTDSPRSMHPVLKELVSAGIRIWIYSGDADAILPLSATRLSIRALKLNTIVDWHAWYDDRHQVNFTFISP